MKFTCLLPVRDEADIIGQCISQLLTWADEIYVFDTGSVDNTWEIVQDFSLKDKRVVPLRKDPVFYSETLLRGWLFNQARQKMRNGDWFLRVDSDEFHHIKPSEFIKERLRSHETIVYHQYYDFALLASEAEQWESMADPYLDRKLPIEERRTWYTTSVYSEPRMCKYRESMKWPSSHSFPVNAGFVARERFPIRHYPHRDPAQLDRRCRLRAVMMADTENRKHWGAPEQHHWSSSEWKKFITPDETPGLRQWIPGTPLLEVKQLNHIAKPPKRLVQRMVHGFMLPMLDKTRTEWREDQYPQKISLETTALLQQTLKL